MFTLGRKIDIHYKTNIWIVILTILSAIGGGIVAGDFGKGVTVALSVFLSWAITREVDPAHEYSAFISALIAASLMFFDRDLELLPFFFIILSLRMINGSTGKKLKILDVLAVLLLALFLFYRDRESIYIFTLILALTLSFNRFENKNIFIISLLASIIAFSVQIFYIDDISTVFSISDISWINIIAIVLGYLGGVFLIEQKSAEDDKGNMIKKSNMKKSQVFFISIFILLFLLDKLFFANFLLFASIIIAFLTYNVIFTLFKRTQS